MKILKIILKFIGILIIIAIIGGIGITLTKLNEKPIFDNMEDENIEQMQEEISIDNESMEVAEEIKTEEIPEIQEVAVANNDPVTENTKSNTEQKTSTNNQTTAKQESKTTATLPATSNAETTPANNPGGVENTNSNNPVRCTNNNNHGTEVGNSKDGATGWYNTKAQAVADYTSKVNYWSEKWGNYEIDTATYEKNCPSGYEVWTCYYCNKWTINYYYK